MPYRGPVQIAVLLPDGRYEGPDGTVPEVRGGVARLVTSLPAGAGAAFARRGPVGGPPAFRDGPLSVAPGAGGRIALRWSGRELGALDLGLVAIPGTAAGPEDAARE